MKLNSLQKKMMVIFGAILFVALCILGGVSYGKARQLLFESVSDNASILARDSAEQIGLWLKGHQSEIEMTARSTVIASGDLKQILPYIQSLRGQDSEYVSITYIQADGTFHDSAGYAGSVAEREYFQRAMRGETVITDPFLSKTTGLPVVLAAVPVWSEGRVTGVVTGALGMEAINGRILSVKLGQTGYAFALQKNGLIIVHPDPAMARSMNVLEQDGIDPDMKEAARAMVRGEIGAARYTFRGNDKLVAYAPIPGVGWSLGVTVPTAELSGRLTQLTVITLLTSLAVLLVVAAAIIIFSRRIARPVIEMEIAAKQMASGDLTVALRSADSGDEIGRLAQSFHRMAQEIKASMDALTMAREKYAKAFRYASDVIGLMNLRDERNIEVSDAFYHRFGYERETVIGHSFTDLGLWCEPQERAAVMAGLQLTGTCRDAEVRWRMRSGEIRLGLYSVETIEIGNELCALYVWHDITERKQAEDALRQFNVELEQKVDQRTRQLYAANQSLTATNRQLNDTVLRLRQTQEHLIEAEKMAALGSLVAGVAHEVNTPLGNGVTAASFLHTAYKRISGQFAQGTLTSRQLKEYLEDSGDGLRILEGNLERAARMVQSFKNIAIDQMVEEAQTFALRPYLEQIVLMLTPQLKRTQLRVDIDCPEELEWNSYPGVFAQILTNFVTNAVTHAYAPGEEGRLTIAAWPEGGELVVRFADDGRGMAEGERKRIFEPFYTTRRGEGGTGLGLYIVYNLVTQTLGGTITCFSHPGNGTAFLIRIPDTTARAAARTEP